MSVLPALNSGLLPPGIHQASWAELEALFGATPHRVWLLAGLRRALAALALAGCRRAYVDGSFVTAKEPPDDYDLCWDLDHVDLGVLDPIFFDVNPPRAAQKAKYRGDLLPNVVESGSGMPFVDFFQVEKHTGATKGIVAIDPRSVP